MSPLTPTPRGSATEQSTYCDCMQRLSLRGFCLLQPRNWILERRRRLGCSSKTLLSAQRLDSLHAGLAPGVLHAKANERPTGTDQPGDPCSETVHEVLGQYHIQSNSRVERLLTWTASNDVVHHPITHINDDCTQICHEAITLCIHFWRD